MQHALMVLAMIYNRKNPPCLFCSICKGVIGCKFIDKVVVWLIQMIYKNYMIVYQSGIR